ncbi:hypothetical protein [Cytobacillus massiliigabonensis]|uniref:hypothetical protein n=1 Tax=Cytobacillus massiliigabonensis TaxID=1871011 RepID=UPI000C82A548|nr:hypothetical protein [Cytobacillus massiliigabonensis]
MEQNEIKGGGAAVELSNDLNVITAEINSYLAMADECLYQASKRMLAVRNAKLNSSDENERLIATQREDAGGWLKWLELVNVHPRVAQQMMKVFRELGEKTRTSSHLGLEVLYQIATLAPEHRDQPHIIPSTGETKTADEMTVRELREVKKALKEAEEARRAAEKQRDLAERDAEILRDTIESIEDSEPVAEVKTEYIEIIDEKTGAELSRYKELFGDISMYEGKTTRVTNGDAITYAVFEFSEDVRKFIEKYGHLTHFAREFNEMISEGKTEYTKAIGSMIKFLGEIDRNLHETEIIILEN